MWSSWRNVQYSSILSSITYTGSNGVLFDFGFELSIQCSDISNMVLGLISWKRIHYINQSTVI